MKHPVRLTLRKVKTYNLSNYYILSLHVFKTCSWRMLIYIYTCISGMPFQCLFRKLLQLFSPLFFCHMVICFDSLVSVKVIMCGCQVIGPVAVVNKMQPWQSLWSSLDASSFPLAALSYMASMILPNLLSCRDLQHLQVLHRATSKDVGFCSVR